MAAPRVRLNHRERYVITLLAAGRVLKEIADELHISVSRMKQINSRLLRKAGVSSRSELMVWAMRRRLLKCSTYSMGTTRETRTRKRKKRLPAQ